MELPKSLALTAILAAIALPSSAQPAMEGFAPIDKYVFVLDGEEQPGAEIYQSQAAGSFLVITSGLESPVLVAARSAAVSTVNLMKVDQQPNGNVNLLAGSTLEPLGKFTIAGDGIRFTVGDRPAELRNKPWLLGAQDLEGMRAYSAGYRRGADEYECSEPLLRQLREDGRPVEVKVFFGSWCPHCEQVLPRVLKVAEELEGSGVRLSFYGLPRGRGFSIDAEVKRFDIETVPTGVVLIDGREVGRISGSGWKIPELAIKNAIEGP